MKKSNLQRSTTRRRFLRLTSTLVAGAAVADSFALKKIASAQTSGPGFPFPDELVDATLKRLFANRTLQRGDDKIKLELPQIAEDGGNVAITVDSTLPVSGTPSVSNLYLISDKNRRPLLVKFSFAPESGRAFVSTSIRLAMTTDVRAIVEMADGTLYAVSKHVRVTISGCDLPPQS